MALDTGFHGWVRFGQRRGEGESLPGGDNYTGKYTEVGRPQIGLGKGDKVHFPGAEKTQEKKMTQKRKLIHEVRVKS